MEPTLQSWNGVVIDISLYQWANHTYIYHIYTCVIALGLARFYMKNKQYAQGIELYKKTLDIAREVYGASHPQV